MSVKLLYIIKPFMWLSDGVGTCCVHFSFPQKGSLWHVTKTLNLSDMFSKGMCRLTSSSP